MAFSSQVGLGDTKIKINALFILAKFSLLFFILIARELILLLTLNLKGSAVLNYFFIKMLGRLFIHRIEQLTIFTHNMLSTSMLLEVEEKTKDF